MAPEPERMTAGTTSPTKPSPSGRPPHTTKENEEAYAWKKAQSKAKMLSSPPTPSGSQKKKAKPKSIPPPGEAFQPPSRPKPRMTQLSTIPRVTGLGRVVGVSKKFKSNGKGRAPLTTKEKEQAAKEKEIGRTVMKGLEKNRRKEERTSRKDEEDKKRGEKAGLVEKEDNNEKGVQEEEKQRTQGKAKGRKQNADALGIHTVSAQAPTSTAWSDRQTLSPEDTQKASSVLFRPTERAKHNRRAMDAKAKVVAAKAFSSASAGGWTVKNSCKIEKTKKKDEAFRVMNLPEVLRNRIWRMAVVYHPFCVWPGQKRGGEQPDVAMTGNEVREETLELYYGKNVFGVDITPLEILKDAEPTASAMRGEESGTSPKKSTEEGALTGLDGQLNKVPKPENMYEAPKAKVMAATADSISEIKPWAKALEISGHLSKIQHWIFDCAPTVARNSLKLDESRCLVVCLNIWLEQGRWRANVEVHREACCVLPGSETFAKCVVKNSPELLNTMVAFVLEKAEMKGLTAELLVGMASMMRERVGELVELRCSSFEA